MIDKKLKEDILKLVDESLESKTLNQQVKYESEKTVRHYSESGQYKDIMLDMIL